MISVKMCTWFTVRMKIYDILTEIDTAAQATRRLLEELPEGIDLLSPQAIQTYYQIYYGDQRAATEYVVPDCSGKRLRDNNGRSTF